jgi:hypothetical protein
MAPKRIRKPIHDTIVEEPTHDLNVPSKTIREEEQKDYEKQENHDDHENENEQLAIIFFIQKQLEVLFKMNRSKEVGCVLENQSYMKMQ